MLCPRCNAQMHTHGTPAPLIHWCPQCGVLHTRRGNAIHIPTGPIPAKRAVNPGDAVLLTHFKSEQKAE